MKASQNSRILKHLMGGNSLTPIQALNLFDCFRLSARCHDLKADGFPIVSRNITKNNKTFSQYYLEESYRPL